MNNITIFVHLLIKNGNMRKKYETPQVRIENIELSPMLIVTSAGAQGSADNLHAFPSGETMSGSSALSKQRGGIFDSGEDTGSDIEWDLGL